MKAEAHVNNLPQEEVHFDTLRKAFADAGKLPHTDDTADGSQMHSSARSGKPGKNVKKLSLPPQRGPLRTLGFGGAHHHWRTLGFQGSPALAKLSDANYD